MAPTPPQFTGKSLFSFHYLATRLPNHAEWQEDAQATFAAVRVALAQGPAAGRQLERGADRGRVRQAGAGAPGLALRRPGQVDAQGQLNRPDYALFADDASRDAAYPRQGDDAAFYGQALAIAEAKYWGRPLSQQTPAAATPGRKTTTPATRWSATWWARAAPGASSPTASAGASTAARSAAPPASTTKSTWTPFSNTAAMGPTAVARQGPTCRGWQYQGCPHWPRGRTGRRFDAFKRWWLFFRRAAFTPDSQGRSFVQRIHAGSATYAKEISDKLKELVFREVMPRSPAASSPIAAGELGIRAEDAASLHQIYQASLSLLYKLLFVLYAEARSLLPVDQPRLLGGEPDAHGPGLCRQASTATSPSATPPTPPRQYEALLALFRRIDLGDASLGVPRYDGGLFDRGQPRQPLPGPAQAQRPRRRPRRGHPGARRGRAGGLRLSQRAQPGQHLRRAAGEQAGGGGRRVRAR